MTGIASAADFIGKFKSKLDNKMIEGDVFVLGLKYCLMLEQDGEKGKVIVDTGKMRQPYKGRRSL